MSKEAIVEKIISDAHLKADSIVAEANAKADEIIAKAAEECKEYLYSTKSETDRMVFDVDARSKTVAELDAKNSLSPQRRKCLTLCTSAFSKTCEISTKRLIPTLFSQCSTTQKTAML